MRRRQSQNQMQLCDQGQNRRRGQGVCSLYPIMLFSRRRRQPRWREYGSYRINDSNSNIFAKVAQSVQFVHTLQRTDKSVGEVIVDFFGTNSHSVRRLSIKVSLDI